MLNISAFLWFRGISVIQSAPMNGQWIQFIFHLGNKLSWYQTTLQLFFYVFYVAPFWHIKLHGHSSRNIGQIEVNKKSNSFTWKMQVKMIYFCKRSSWNPRCIHRLNICDFSYLDVDLNTNFNQGHWSREVHVGQMVPTFAKVKDLH
jgi:hypothetical protein